MPRVLAFPFIFIGVVSAMSLAFLYNISCAVKAEVTRVNTMGVLAEVMLDATLVEMTVGPKAELIVVAMITELDVC
jgi:hypothetical protein